MPLKTRLVGIGLIILGLLLFIVKYYVPVLAKTVLDAFIIVILGVVFIIISFRSKY